MHKIVSFDLLGQVNNNNDNNDEMSANFCYRIIYYLMIIIVITTIGYDSTVFSLRLQDHNKLTMTLLPTCRFYTYAKSCLPLLFLVLSTQRSINK